MKRLTLCTSYLTSSHLLSYLEIESILAESEDPEELKYYWEQWYNLAGTPTKNNFATYVRLKNQAARLNSKFCKLVMENPLK